MKQIREIGAYEIVLYDKDDNRLSETVVTTSLAVTESMAKETIADTENSYTISKIVCNSKYNNWAPKRKE